MAEYETENGTIEMPWWGWLVISAYVIGMSAVLAGVLFGAAWLSSHLQL